MISVKENELNLFFDNSIFGAFFMMLDQPVEWDETINRDQVVEYMVQNLRVTRVNRKFLEQYGAEEAQILDNTPIDFFKHDISQAKELIRKVLKHGKYKGYTYEKNVSGSSLIIEGDYILLRESDKNSLGKIMGVFGIQQDITKQEEQRRKLERSLKEKETLLTEIHHRVKNNLAIVSGMMQIQAMESNSEIVRGYLSDSIFRIQTMAAIHDLLYSNSDFSNIEISTIIEKLIFEIRNALQNGKQVDLHIQKSRLRLHVGQAIPLSLIVNELVTNIFKHAFKEQNKGEVEVKIDKTEGQLLKFSIEDNGTGYPDHFDAEQSSSVGLHMIRVLTRQLGGECSFQNTDKGALFTLQFKIEKDKGVESISM